MNVSSPLCGRSNELETIAAVMSGLDRNRVTLIEVTGDPGLGKTRLLTEAALAAEQRGLVVMWGRGHEAERYSPFSLITDALTDHLLAADSLVERLVADSPYYATLLTAFPDVPSVPGVTLPFAKTSRQCLFRAARTLVERLQPDRGLVLILDDVHWADEYSIEWLDFLHTHPARVPVVVVFAFRPRQAPPRLMAVTSRPTFREVAVSLPLRPLGRSDIRRLTGCRTGTGDVYECSGGNPFYAQMYAQSRRSSTAAPAGASDLCVDGPFANVVCDELDRATPTAVIVAEAAAVACDRVSLPSVAAAAVSLNQAEVGVDELVWRDILRRADSVVRFRHPLVGAAVASRVPGPRRRAAQVRATDAVAGRRPTQAVTERSPEQQRLRLLTARERQIARFVAEGLTNKQIARRLGVSDKTIEAHLAKVFSKLGVASRAAVSSLIARGPDG